MEHEVVSQVIGWDMVKLIVGFTAAINGVTLIAFKFLLSGATKPLADTQTKMTGELRRLEHDFLTHQAQLPLQYIAKDDWIRQINLIDAKMDTGTERQARMRDILQTVAADVKTLKERASQ